MPGTSPAANILTRFLRFFFYLIYEPLAWSYDLTAWAVSLGRWKSWIKTTLPELTGFRTLELGHGPGHLQLSIRESSLHSFGIDQSFQMSRIAYRRLFKSNFPPLLARSQAEFLPFQNGVFDQVVSTFPSEYIFQPKTLIQAKRVLRPGGKLIVLPMAWIRGTSILERAAAWLFRVTGQAGAWDTRYSEPLRRAGFSVQEKIIHINGSEIILMIGTVST
jgi:ubiquinone/menaquinone biosynthesis C-methylase UbiE